MSDPHEILLTSDFSERSDRPLARALQLAKESGGTVAIAHVAEHAEGDADAAMTERLRLQLPPEARSAQLVVRAGSAPKTLGAIAAERGSDLIVTGVARYNSIGDYVLGTTVDHLIRNAEAPVLVVRRRTDGPYRHIVTATDFSDCSRAALLAVARSWPEIPITVVNAFHVPFEGWLKSADVKQHVAAEARKELDSFMAHPEIALLADRIEAVIDEGEIAVVVQRQLERTGADLLALGTHGRSGFAHATIGSQAEVLLKVVNADVLVVREQASGMRIR